MSKTGLLILSNPARVKKYLPVIKNHVLQTLYIQYSPEKKIHQLKTICPNFMTSIYALATSGLSRIDVRVLANAKRQIIATRRPVEVVMFDRKCSPEDGQLFINKFLSNRTTSCRYISLVNDNEEAVEEEREALEEQVVVYDNVVLGGTFDRLHNGHKILLTEAVLRSKKKVTVGVTDESMIKGKVLWELIEPCERRIEAVKDFLEDINDSLAYEIVPISDMYGPTATENNLDLIIVSEETKRGGAKINELRKERGLKPLSVHIVNLAEDSERSAHEEAKISSSNQRMRLLGTRLKEPTLNTKNLSPYVIGLTGGIASGKSSVAEKLSSLGAGVVHCDKLAHDLYEPNQKCFKTIVELFGEDIVGGDGKIDRKKLGGIVFNDEKQLERLNKAIWPAILEAAQSEISKLHKQGYEIIVMEAAVLIQAKWQSSCHEIWTCIIPHREAITRMMERNNLSEEEAEARIKVQPNNIEQVDAATVVFSTLWSHEITMEQVNRAWYEVQNYLKNKKQC